MLFQGPIGRRRLRISCLVLYIYSTEPRCAQKRKEKNVGKGLLVRSVSLAQPSCHLPLCFLLWSRMVDRISRSCHSFQAGGSRLLHISNCAAGPLPQLWLCLAFPFAILYSTTPSAQLLFFELPDGEAYLSGYAYFGYVCLFRSDCQTTNFTLMPCSLA